MDLNHLEYFLVTSKYENISRAAEELHISQPNLSNALTKLEKELGVLLLDRRRGKITVTAAGKLLAGYIQQSLNTVAEGISYVKEFAVEPTLTLVSNLQQLGTHILRDYWLKHRDVHVQYNLCPSEACVSALEDGSAEIAILSLYDSTQTVHFTPVCSEELFVFTGKQHPLAGEKTVRLADLSNEMFFCDDMLLSKRALSFVFAPAHFTPKVRLNSTESSTLPMFMDTGLGVGLFPSLIIPYDIEGILARFSLMRIIDYDCTRTIGVATSQNGVLTEEAEGFIDFVKDRLLDQSRQAERFIASYFGDFG